MYTGILLPVPYGSMCCPYHQLKYSSPNRSKTIKQEPHKIAYLSDYGGLGPKEVTRMGQSQKGKNG